MENIKKWLIGAFAASSVMLSGCDSSKEKENANDLSGCEAYKYVESVSDTHVYGKVCDTYGNALANVIVTSGTDTVLTLENGAYKFERSRSVNGRCVVKFEHPEYFSVVRTAEAQGGEALVNAIMMPQDMMEGKTDVSRYYNSQGITIKVGEMSITIPANALVYEKDGSEFNGSVFASTYYLSPNSENFAKEMPGGDMSGVTADGKSVILLSYGMVEVTLKDSLDQKLQLKAGAESTLSFPIPEGYAENKKYAEIPLWYFDEEKGTWIEEGVATKNGSVYTGKIKHFSWHNLDYPYVRATIKGRVLDKNGKPLPDVLVTISETSARSDTAGYYSAYVPNETPVIVTVKSNDYAGCPNCPIYHVEGLPAGSTYNQDVILPCMPSIHGVVRDLQGMPIGGVCVAMNKTDVFTKRNGQYTIYYSGNEPVKLGIQGYNAYGGRYSEFDVKKTHATYEFNDPSEIDENKSYDFLIDRPVFVHGSLYLSNGGAVYDPINVTVNVDGKEYGVFSRFGHYCFCVSSGCNKITAYVKASDAYGVESNKVELLGLRYYNYLRALYVKSGISVRGSFVNTCGPSISSVTLEVGKGKNKKTYSKNTRFGYFRFDLPFTLRDSKGKVIINSFGTRQTKKFEIDGISDVNLGEIEMCAGIKPEPNCFYVLFDDKTVKFDTKKDKYTEMYQIEDEITYKNGVRVTGKTVRYQAWYKVPGFNGALIVELGSGKYDRERIYLVADGTYGSKNLVVKKKERNQYVLKTDGDIFMQKQGTYDFSDYVYLFGSAEIERKEVDKKLITEYVTENMYNQTEKILVGVSKDTKFFTLQCKELKLLEKTLLQKGFKEHSTFLNDEGKVASIYLKENVMALITRKNEKMDEVTVLLQNGIENGPIYHCWKMDFGNSSMTKRGERSVDYSWKNDAEMIQLVMFGQAMGVNISKTDISSEKCGCTTSTPSVAN